MSRAVRYDNFGELDVLRVDDVPRPTPDAGEVLVRVKAAGTNPGESSVRRGNFAEVWPSTFPSGQGTDFAGIVEEVGSDVQAVHVGDEVIGFTNNRGSQADLVVVPAEQTTPKPDKVSWEAAGGLFVAGTTAYAAVRAVHPTAGETVVVSGAAGGVGSLVAQLARHAGADVIGIAGDANHDWLRDLGLVPVAHGDGTIERVREAAPDGVDAFIDTFGGGYVAMAIELGVAPERVNTIIDFDAVNRFGVKAAGSAEAGTVDVLAEVAALIAAGDLEVPIAATFPLDEVQDAYRRLEQRHSRGKIVLIP